MRWYKKYTGYVKEGLTYATYPFRPRRDPSTKFLIFTVGRTGSTLLVRMLNDHPNIQCYSELLGKRVLFPAQYLKSMEQLSSKDVYGFKIITFNFDVQGITDPQSFLTDLQNRGYKIIFLERLNILRQSISHLYAEYRQTFHQFKKDGSSGYQPMYLDLETLQKDLEMFKQHRQLADSIIGNFSHLSLSYEDDLLLESCHQQTVDRVSKYLGIPTASVQTDLLRTTPSHLSEFLANYAEVCDYISKTEYKLYLE